MQTVQQWYQLPKEVVDSLSFKVLKTQEDKALSNLVWLITDSLEQEVGFKMSRGYFKHELFHDSQFLHCFKAI